MTTKKTEDTKVPKVEELTDAELDKASGGILDDDIGLLVKGEGKTGDSSTQIMKQDPHWLKDGSSDTTKK